MVGNADHRAGALEIVVAGHAQQPVRTDARAHLPRIAVVATIDLPRVGQARPGDALRFVELTLHEATQQLRKRERALARLARGLEVTR